MHTKSIQESLNLNIDEINSTGCLTLTPASLPIKGVLKYLNLENFHLTKATAKKGLDETIIVEGQINVLGNEDVSAILTTLKSDDPREAQLTFFLDNLTIQQIYDLNLVGWSLAYKDLPSLIFSNIQVTIFLGTQEFFLDGSLDKQSSSFCIKLPPLRGVLLSIALSFQNETILTQQKGLKAIMQLNISNINIFLAFPEEFRGWKVYLTPDENNVLSDIQDLNTLIVDEQSAPDTLLPPDLPPGNKLYLKQLVISFPPDNNLFSTCYFSVYSEVDWPVFSDNVGHISSYDLSYNYARHFNVDNSSYLTFHGNLIAKGKLFGIDEEIQIPLPPLDGSWRLISRPSREVASIGALTKQLGTILGDKQMLDIIPPEFSVFSNIGLRSIELGLTTGQQKPLAVGISIGLMESWTLPYLPKATLRDMGLEFQIKPAIPITDTELYGRVYGILLINQTTLSVFIKKEQADAHWTMGLDFQDLQIGLPEIAEIMGINKDIFTSYLPSSLSIIKDLKLIDFDINFDINAKNLTSAGLDVKLLAPWVLLENKVIVENLGLSVQVDNPLKSSRIFYGNFWGAINLGNFAYLLISANNSASPDGKDWVLSGSSDPNRPIHITELAKHFFEWLDKDHTWPDWVPQVDLKELMVSYHTSGTQALTFDAGVEITLTDIDQYLGDFFPYAILQAGLHIASAKDPAAAGKRQLNGTLKSTVALGEHLKFGIAYDFLPGNHILSLLMGEQVCKLQKSPEGTFLIAEINHLNIGDIVTLILQLISDKKKLTFPFDILNSVSIAHLTLKLNLTKRKAALATTNLYQLPSQNILGNTFADFPDIDLADSPTAIRTIWIPIQKALGPLYFERIGVQSAGKSMKVLFDASFAFSGLALELAALSFGFPIKDPKEFDWTQILGLDGIGVSFCRGPVQLLGALLKSKNADTPDLVDYSGEISIKAHTLGFSALGAYASIDGWIPSVCAFVSVNIPIGGPPYISLKGLAGGFGVNRDLRLPTPDEILTYPLVKGAMGDEDSFKNRKPLDGLRALGKYLSPALGRGWLAAGVKISSMEMIEAFGLVTVCLGTKVEVAFLGVGRVTLPKGAPDPVFKAELALEAIFSLDQFLICFGGGLTSSSYILSRDCHITGGFNFSIWFGLSHLGDFVITLGGFNPYIEIPSHYPNPPRLGLSWQFSDNLLIKGGAYFAVTPKRMMVGGDLDLVWKSPGLNVIFTAQMNFIMSWLPYYYKGKIPAHITASYELNTAVLTKTLTFSADALLDLWGPSFSGKATITVSFLSFAFSFGEKPRPPEPISWNEFKNTFLPVTASPSPDTFREEKNASTVCTIRMASGVIKEFEAKANDNISCVAEPATFSTIISTVVPAKKATINSTYQTNNWNKEFGIGMVGVDNESLESELSITLSSQQNPNIKIKADYLPENMSAALWGEAGVALDEKSPDLKANLLSGFRLSSYLIPSDTLVPVVTEKLLYHTVDPILLEEWSSVNLPTGDKLDQSQAFINIMKTLKDINILNKRAEMLYSLREQGLEFTQNIYTAAISERAAEVFSSRPILSYLGSTDTVEENLSF